MGGYVLSKEEIIDKFDGFLIGQEGEIHADVIAEVWNELSDRLEWGEYLKVCNKDEAKQK